MNLYLLTQDIVDGYDTYDSVVVVAESEEDAKTIHPSSSTKVFHDNQWWGIYAEQSGRGGQEYDLSDSSWPSTPEGVKVIYLGEAVATLERGVVCASFNAG